MEIKLIVVGKTTEKYLQEGISHYLKRLRKYVKFTIIELQGLKSTGGLSIEQVKAKECDIISRSLDCDNVILLDERGKEYTSVGFAELLRNYMNRSAKCLTFVVGGSYGFTDSFRKQYPSMALSQMTFAHQMVRLFFVEQLYRAFTILKSEPYHH